MLKATESSSFPVPAIEDITAKFWLLSWLSGAAADHR